MDKNPEISNPGNGGEDKVELSKAEYDKLVEERAKGLEAQARMKDEITQLREKIRTENPSLQPEDITKAVEAEFKKREADQVKKNIEEATQDFLSEHQEFSKENDPDGSKLASFQKALGQFSLSGVKTKEDYTQVLNNAMRLTPEVSQPVTPIVSTPRTPSIPGGKPSARLSDKEIKLVQRSFGGDVEAYLKVKTKRPEYVEGLLDYIR